MQSQIMVASFIFVIEQKTAFKNFHVSGSAVRGKVPPESPYLNGHFPGMPVFPAVGIVDASLYFVRRVSGNESLQLDGIPSAKFLSPIAPDQELRIEVKALEEKNWQLEWKDEQSSKTFAALRLRVI